jgi:periplasmic divalent cation tolerance protein
MTPEDDDLRVLWASCPETDAAALVRTLVEEHLVACGNIVSGVRSIYRWQGAVCDEQEALLLMETTATRLDAAMDRLRALHPYEVPKILALHPCDVDAAYLQWVRGETTTS